MSLSSVTSPMWPKVARAGSAIAPPIQRRCRVVGMRRKALVDNRGRLRDHACNSHGIGQNTDRLADVCGNWDSVSGRSFRVNGVGSMRSRARSPSLAAAATSRVREAESRENTRSVFSSTGDPPGARRLQPRDRRTKARRRADWWREGPAPRQTRSRDAARKTLARPET